MSELEILKDENIRHWLWWTLIPISLIIGGTIASVAASKWKKRNE